MLELLARTSMIVVCLMYVVAPIITCVLYLFCYIADDGEQSFTYISPCSLPWFKFTSSKFLDCDEKIIIMCVLAGGASLFLLGFAFLNKSPIFVATCVTYGIPFLLVGCVTLFKKRVRMKKEETKIFKKLKGEEM